MKKLLLLLLFVVGAVNAQIVNIPDPVFKAKLLSANVSNTIASTNTVLNNSLSVSSYVKIDTNNDGEIQVSEALLIRYINVSGTYNLNGGITDLTGIEAFVNLKFLKCYYNSITSLNFANNLDLRFLHCSYNQLTNINVALNTNLQNLYCNGNHLTTLDVSHNLILNSLECSDNLITNLSLIQNIGLSGLNCSQNLLTDLNVYNLTYLAYLECSYNQLTSLNVSNNNSLTSLECSGNQLTSLDISNNLSLQGLSFGFNNISSIDVTQHTGLTYLQCEYNQLTSLDVTHNINLFSLYCSGNQLTSLNVLNLTNLNYFECNSNQFTNLDVTHNINLQRLYCFNNQLTTLNVEHSPNLDVLNCVGNNLTSLFIKNGSVENYLDFYANPNLQYICADEDQIASVQALAGANVVVSSYCSFTPGGNTNAVSGVVHFDMDNNGCTSTDPALPNSVHLNITDGAVSSGTFPTTDGSYLLYTLTGSNVLTTSLENPTYFTISPSTATVTTTTLGNTQTQDFCITANGVHKDAEIIIVPIQLARPGFEATYKIVYKNKGNQTLSGDLNFTYDDSVLDYVSSSVNPTTQTTGTLGWNYTNLLPFESRSFTITLHVNAPTDTPPVNIGDLLNYTATINPISGDETPLDNVFTYNQIVIGAFDPNNKICLEGEVVASAKIGDYLHYNINFENTGTAPAENIVVKDVIDMTKYNINSMQIMNASHPVKTRITGNKVEFVFQNINLGASQYGNVVFKIKTLSNLTIGTTATNTANIYFDYNFPIQTNTASTTFQNLNNGQFVIDNSIVVAPNPTSSYININVDNNNTIKSVQVFDIQGRLLETQLINDMKTAINLSEKTMGVYFLKITSDKGSKIEKIVKE
jgi:uncharacterized repeat protein (TIGR01451 family)